MGSNREQQLVDKIRQLLPDSKKKYTWTDIEKTDKLQDLAFELTSTYFGDFFATQQQASIDRLQAAACFLNFLHTIADCENDEAEVDEGHYGLWLLTVSNQEERLMHLNQLADCLLLFKRTMGSIEALQKEDAALRMEAQKMSNEINFYQEEIASNKEQIDLYKTEIKKQTGIKVDTTKQIEKLNNDLSRIQNNYTSLEKIDNELDSTLEGLKVREKLLESQLMVSSLNDVLCENGNYLKENAKLQSEIHLMKHARQLQDDKQHSVLEPAITSVKTMCEQLDGLTPRAITIQNLSSNIDRLTRDIESTKETTDKLRVLNPIGTEDDSSFTSMLTNAQVELAQQKENFDKRNVEFERTTVAYELIKRSVDDPNLYKDVYAMEKRVETARQQHEQTKNKIIQVMADALNVL
ncbi:unnamed protein product [Adineta steineri]|uniref:Uncharacterized protein n=1 Tax=Adineta steineri TaxID=433720 RepID=A0A815IYA6_9BILA|nr:unnamed protein product [Adineta steineri]CAF1371920.1 unnamed protein product [Adineta steineri]CAF3835143.1 unnamed protein product [Adineta steineri]